MVAMISRYFNGDQEYCVAVVLQSTSYACMTLPLVGLCMPQKGRSLSVCRDGCGKVCLIVADASCRLLES